jgi:two-component system sensor histidine kinase GlrK
MLKNFRPHSLVAVLVSALLVVTLPLLIALVAAMQHVDRLSRHGLLVAVDAETATEAGQRLRDAVRDMERNALQFLVVEDEKLLGAYRDRHVDFLAAARDLERVPGQRPSRASLYDLMARERYLFDRLTGGAVSDGLRDEIDERFGELSRAARALVQANSLQVWRAASVIPQQADELNDTLLQLTAVSIVVTIALVLLFAFLIHRPLRRLDTAIRDLGAGRFDTPIQIDHGSADLSMLGDRLDWLRRKLKEIDAEKAGFLRQISHELKTPLAAVREGAALLSEDTGATPRAERSQIAGIVLENTLRLQRLIENLLQLNAVGSLTTQGRRESVDLRQIIERVINDHSLSLAAKSITLTKELYAAQAVGDPEQLRIVVDNLLSNAVKFAPRGGRIGLSLTQSDGCYAIEVRDSGPGIEAGEQDRIFEPFYQGRIRPSSSINGTGLGLAIVWDFVRAHGGTIEVIPSHDGAYFRVCAPDTPPDAGG